MQRGGLLVELHCAGGQRERAAIRPFDGADVAVREDGRVLEQLVDALVRAPRDARIVERLAPIVERTRREGGIQLLDQRSAVRGAGAHVGEPFVGEQILPPEQRADVDPVLVGL